MRRQIIVVFLSLLCLVQSPVQAAQRGALFKVESGGHTMHLFGTIHVGRAEFFPLEPRIASLVAGASTLALEIDPMMDPGAMTSALLQRAMVDPEKAGYRTRSKALRTRLERALGKAHIAPGAVAGYKPWLVAATLSLAEYAAQGYIPENSVDLGLARIARAATVPVLELESVDQQLAMFDRLSSEQQWRFLDESLATLESGKQRLEIREVIDAWGNADQAKLDAIALRAKRDTSTSGKFLQQVMLEERNSAMADKLAQLLAREDNSVAAIGVLHLLGDSSVPAMLRARGVQVERVY